MFKSFNKINCNQFQQITFDLCVVSKNMQTGLTKGGMLENLGRRRENGNFQSWFITLIFIYRYLLLLNKWFDDKLMLKKTNFNWFSPFSIYSVSRLGTVGLSAISASITKIKFTVNLSHSQGKKAISQGLI